MNKAKERRADMDYESFCNDCKKHTETVHDHATGDVICVECGLVAEERFITDEREWRVFADSDNDNDPRRVGGKIDRLYEDVGLTTKIGLAAGKKSKSCSSELFSSSLLVGMRQNGIVDADRALIHGYQEVDTMADRLGLVHGMKQSAQLIYQKVLQDDHSIKCFKGKAKGASLAALLYIACAQENMPRTIEEICSVSNTGVTKAAVFRAKERIVKVLGFRTAGQPADHIKFIRPKDLMRRFCNSLGMEHKMVEAAVEAAVRSEQYDIRRTPKSIAAALIVIMLQLTGQKKIIQDVSYVTGVSKNTIRTTYKDLYPHVTEIVPTQYAKEGNLMRLPKP